MKKLIIIIISVLLAIGAALAITNLFPASDSNTDTVLEPGQSDTIIVTVGPERVPCVGVGPTECLVVDGDYFYDSIDGFTYEPGFEYNLELRRTAIENPPADASSLRYELIRELSKTPVLSGPLDSGLASGGSQLAPLYAYNWQLLQINFSGRQPELIENTSDFELAFNADNQFTSTTDCNNLMGTFANSGTDLSFSQIASTRMACPPNVLADEYETALGSIDTMTIEFKNDIPTLTLSHSMGSLEFIGIPRDYSLETVSDAQYCLDLKSRVAGSENYVVMTEITDGSLLTNGQELAGCVYAPNGSYAGWAPFEAQVGSFTLTAPDGTILDQGPLSVTTDDWMQVATNNQPLKYVADLNFEPGLYTDGTLTLRNENASGEPENDRTIEINVIFTN